MNARRALLAAVPITTLVASLTACTTDGLPPEARASVRCRAALLSGEAAAASMRWTVVDDSAGRARLDAYCAAAGPALIHAPGPPAARQTRSAGDGLAVVAWNIALGGGGVRRLIEDLRNGRLTAAPPADFVLLLQEVPRFGAAVPPQSALPEQVLVSSPDAVPGPDVLELARAERLHLLFVPSMREAPLAARIDHGTAILSTLPLSQHRAIELPAGNRRRVATAASVDWPVAGTPLHVVSVHLDNFSFDRFFASFGAIRARQAGALARALPDDGSVILGGDLNTWTGGTRERAYRLLREHLPRPASLQPEPTARRLGVPRRLDYLLADLPTALPFEVRRIEDRYGSDHHPLITFLRPFEQQHVR